MSKIIIKEGRGEEGKRGRGGEGERGKGGEGERRKEKGKRKLGKDILDSRCVNYVCASTSFLVPNG